MTNERRGLRNALGSWTEPAFGRYGTTPKRTMKADKEVTELFGHEARPPAEYDLQRLFVRARRAADRGRLLSLEHRDLRRLPWVLFYPHVSPPGSWLGARADVQRSFREWTGGRQRTSTVVALVHEFLRVHPTHLSTFGDWLELVRSLVASGRSPSIRKLDRELFVENGAEKVVARMIADGNSDVARFGISPGLAGCAFLAAGAFAHVRRVGKGVRSGSVQMKDVNSLLHFLELDDGLRFPDSKLCTEIANELLGSLASGHEVAREVQDRICAWFVKRFGDPRFREHATRWRPVSEDARAVVTGWLVADAVEQFFRLIRETAYDHHWKYRQSFWAAYLKRHLIDDAWFVLGRRARQLLRQISKYEDSACGSLVGGTSDQSVLLMKIDGITVAEWSHNGSCRIWDEDDPRAPQLHKKGPKAYSRDNLASHSADFVQVHHGSQRGRWQARVAKAILDRTGRDVRPREYMRLGR